MLGKLVRMHLYDSLYCHIKITLLDNKNILFIKFLLSK